MTADKSMQNSDNAHVEGERGPELPELEHSLVNVNIYFLLEEEEA